VRPGPNGSRKYDNSPDRHIGSLPGPFRHKRQPFPLDGPGNKAQLSRGKFVKEHSRGKLVKGRPRVQKPGGGFEPPEVEFTGFEPSFQDEGSVPYDEPELPEEAHEEHEPQYQAPHKKKGMRKRKKGTQYLKKKPLNPSINKPYRPEPEMQEPERVVPLSPFPQDPFTGSKEDMIEDMRRFSSGGGPNPVQAPLYTTPKPTKAETNGFFDGPPEDFPSFSDFGVSWDPQKTRRKRSLSLDPKEIRRKRSVIKNPFYYRDERRRRQRPRRRNKLSSANRQPESGSNRRRSQGPSGFWDDVEFDDDFFSGKGPNPFSSYEDLNPVNEYAPTRPTRQELANDYAPAGRPIRLELATYRPQPQLPPQQSPSITQYSSDGYGGTARKSPYYNLQNTINRVKKLQTNSYQPEVSSADYYSSQTQDNEILGSGNFEVIKGGTFYDQDDYRYVPNSANYRPTTYNKDFFHNFRDFADIKEENKARYY